MLQIRRETDYAIRCIYYLAGKEKEITMVDEIAREMSVPKSFLAKILQRLSRADLVKSYVGVQGGFSLTKNPKRISLFDVILAIEGPVAMNKCTVNKKSCSLSSTCRIHPIWVQVRKDIEKVLKKSTFAAIKSAEQELTIGCPIKKNSK
jgi:Rrf2 family protein